MVMFREIERERERASLCLSGLVYFNVELKGTFCGIFLWKMKIFFCAFFVKIFHSFEVKVFSAVFRAVWYCLLELFFCVFRNRNNKNMFD